MSCYGCDSTGDLRGLTDEQEANLCDDCKTELDDIRFDSMSPEDRFEYEWNAPQNQVEHVCEACGVTFKANKLRGPLGFCDGCADKRERGEDLYY